MRFLRPIVSAVTALAFFVQATGLAYASPPQEVQPVPYNPSQPVPVPVQPSYPSAPPPMMGPAPSYAPQGPGGDAVYLKGGGSVRGTLVEMLPNDHATIQLPTGQNAIIEWGKIDHIERAAVGVAPLSAPIAGLTPPPYQRHRREEGPPVLVHLEADQGIVLESVSPGSGRWAVMCAAPCDAQVPLGRQYRVAGDGIRPSRAFGLDAAAGQHVTITVSAASRGAFSGGLALASVGAVAIIAGLTVVLFGLVGDCNFDGSDCVTNGGIETAGAVISVAGVALLVGGIVLVATNARTRTVQTVGDLGPLSPRSPTRPETAWLRAPLWRDSVRDSAGQPKSTGIPIFSHSF